MAAARRRGRGILDSLRTRQASRGRGGWRRAECEVGDVVVDSTTRPADARRATAFVTDSASLARTRGGTHVRDRVLVLDQQQVGTRATHQPRGHTRTGEAGSPSRRGTCGTWGMMYRAQWRRAVAPQVPRSRRRASDQLHRAGLQGERTAQRRERVRNRAQREGGNARRPECRGDARLDTMQPSRSQLLKV
jgi:hypothetical protein